MFARVLYCIFLGFLVCMFVVWAMAAWFPTPQWDTVYPGIEQYPSEPIPPSTEEINFLGAQDRTARLDEYATKREAYRNWETNHVAMEAEFKKKTDKQGLTVAMISMLIAVLLVSVSLWYSGRLQVITEGMLLGGIFTLIYSLGWCFVRAQNIAVIAVGVSLVITIIIGYKKFVQQPLKPVTS
jgi:hypothetical protein